MRDSRQRLFSQGAGGEEEKGLKVSWLPQTTSASLFLGFGQLGWKALRAHGNPTCCGVLGLGQGHAIGTLLHVLGLQLLGLGLPSGKTYALLLVLCVRGL